MAQSFVQIPPDSTGKLIDTWTTAVAGSHRQAIVLADPSVDANVVNIGSTGRLPVETEVQLDYDSGAGTENLSLVGLGLPASGGAVAGGTSTNPLRTDPTGTTTQPVSAASLPLPTGASTLAEQQSQTGVLGATTGAAVITDADGTIQQYLRGIVKLAITVGGWLVTATGNIAHDDADSGNPVKVGSKAITSLPTAVAANDRANQISDVYGRPFVRIGHQGPAGNYWDVQHVPAANAKATATQTSAGAGVRNVCTGFTVTLASNGTAPAAVQLTVQVVDGIATGTTYLWITVIALPAVAGAITSFVRSGLWLPGTADTAMTIEFSAAGGANTIESVTMEGTTVAE